jgi:hypothetical protein
VRADHHALATALGAWLDDHLVETFERVVEDLRIGGVMRGHGAQERLLREVETHHLLDLGVGELVVGDADAEGVEERDLPAQPWLERDLQDPARRLGHEALAARVRDAASSRSPQRRWRRS